MSPLLVSTHSRPKAAGCREGGQYVPPIGFNTQPPEGGWAMRVRALWRVSCFNTQPPEGGWGSRLQLPRQDRVSTHSRPKAAGSADLKHDACVIVSTHSRPKAAGDKHSYNTFIK